MAKVLRKRSTITVPAQWSPTGKPFTAEKIGPYTYSLPPEVAEAIKTKQAEMGEARRNIARYIAIRDGQRPPPWKARELPEGIRPLPIQRTKGVGPSVWAVAQAVFELRWREGLIWQNVENQLLTMVRARTSDNGLSLRTLKDALRFLRSGRHIDC